MINNSGTLGKKIISILYLCLCLSYLQVQWGKQSVSILESCRVLPLQQTQGPSTRNAEWPGTTAFPGSSSSTSPFSLASSPFSSPIGETPAHSDLFKWPLWPIRAATGSRTGARTGGLRTRQSTVPELGCRWLWPRCGFWPQPTGSGAIRTWGSNPCNQAAAAVSHEEEERARTVPIRKPASKPDWTQSGYYTPVKPVCSVYTVPPAD